MSKRKHKDLSQMPVQQSLCKTCPFEGESPLPLTEKARAAYVRSMIQFDSQHLCHSVNNEMICRGGRNLMLQSMAKCGFIPEPTDKAFEQARKQVLGF